MSLQGVKDIYYSLWNNEKILGDRQMMEHEPAFDVIELLFDSQHWVFSSN